VRELRYLWTWAWLTPYSASMRNTPPTPSVQNVCLSVGSGFRLHQTQVKVEEVYNTTHRAVAHFLKSSVTGPGTVLSLIRSTKEKTHSRLAMRLPLMAFLHTSPMPPAW
jgi:hypothetical protein